MGLKEALFANKDKFGPDRPAVDRDGSMKEEESSPDIDIKGISSILSETDLSDGGLFDGPSEPYVEEDERKPDIESVLTSDFSSAQEPVRFNDDLVKDVISRSSGIADFNFMDEEEHRFTDPEPKATPQERPDPYQRMYSQNQESFQAPQRQPQMNDRGFQEIQPPVVPEPIQERVEQPMQRQYEQAPQMVYEQAKNNLRELENDYSEYERSNAVEDEDSDLKEILLFLAKTRILEDIAENYTSQIVTPVALKNAVEAFLNGDPEPYSNYRFVLSAVLDEVISSDYTYQAYDGFISQILESVKKDLR